MSVFVLPDEVSRFLSFQTGEVELRNTGGRVEGRFVPTPSHYLTPAEYDEIMAECSDSGEDLARAQAEGGVHTLAEIWQRLGQTA